MSTLCEHLASDLGDAIRLETPVEKILVHDGRAVGVRVNGVEQEASAVISTAPVHILSKLVEGTTALNHLARFRYRPMVFVNLRLTGRKPSARRRDVDAGVAVPILPTDRGAALHAVARAGGEDHHHRRYRLQRRR